MAITVLNSSESKKSLTQLIESQTTESDVISAVRQRVAEYDNAEKAREDLKQISEARGKHAFAQGGILKRIRDEGWHETYGCPSFERFLDEQGIPRSTAYAHIQLYEHITSAGVCWKDVESLGWTKLRYLAGWLTATNRESWVKLASGVTVAELRRFLKEPDPEKAIAAMNAKVSTRVDTSAADLFPVPKQSRQKQRLSIALHEDQWETVETAFEIARAESESLFDNVALEMICLSFIAGYTPAFGDSYFFGKAVRYAGHDKTIQLIRDIWPGLEITVTDTELSIS